MKITERKILQIMDANYNRAKEAIRVAEDIVRFVLEHPRLMRRFKRLRHDLTRILLALPLSYRELVQSRHAFRDVGRKTLLFDKRNQDSEDLFIANARRSQEALRVLEEMSKVIAPGQARKFQQLRFRLYELEKNCLQKF